MSRLRTQIATLIRDAICAMELETAESAAERAMVSFADPERLVFDYIDVSGQPLDTLALADQIVALVAPTGPCRCDERDGRCRWEHCPQHRDGEPAATNRLCPLPLPEWMRRRT